MKKTENDTPDPANLSALNQRNVYYLKDLPLSCSNSELIAVPVDYLKYLISTVQFGQENPLSLIQEIISQMKDHSDLHDVSHDVSIESLETIMQICMRHLCSESCLSLINSIEMNSRKEDKKESKKQDDDIKNISEVYQ